MAKRSDSRNQPQNYEDNLFLHHLDGNLVELERKFSGFRKGNVSKNHDSFYSHDIHQTNDSVHIHSCFLVGNGFGKKKKMASDDASQLTAPENASDVEEENELAEKHDDENSQLEHLSAAQSCSTIVGEERTCLSNSEAEDEPSRIILAKFSAEEDRVQMRAKRGHGISRHSLAERIRRERISERMKFLQGLVPGCDKITGKAVVLDEIINYVLSLQHQVEFLSMKLAAIDPRGNCQHCCYLSKDIYHSQGGSATTVDDHEMSFLHSLLINNASTNLWKIS